MGALSSWVSMPASEPLLDQGDGFDGSRPATPSPTTPEFDSEMRFHETGYPSEWAESYRPGGFHPVNLGDSFKDGQYRVIRKLGYGSFSTVWLARDKLNVRYVALKVMDAKSSLGNDKELSILEKIKESRPKDANAQHVLEYRDHFEHLGPNGTHVCLVTEPMGPSAASLVENLQQYERHTFDTKIRYPKAMAKQILKHMLLGLVFLHNNGIVHADLQPGNLLFAISDIDPLSEEELVQDQSGQDQESTPEPLRRLDGQIDKWAPRHLYLGQSLYKYTHLDSKMVVKISDFGAAFWAQDPPASTVTPLGLRSPELILGGGDGKIDSSIDIWSFGCLIYELLTGLPLFSVHKFTRDEDERADDDHLLDLNDILEPLPDAWLQQDKWPRASLYFGPHRERLDPDASEGNNYDQDDREEREDQGVGDGDLTKTNQALGGEGEEVEEEPEIRNLGKDGPWIAPSLEDKFKENKPDDIDEAEAQMVTSLIRSILKYEPSQRPSAAQVLEHPWFQFDNGMER